MSSRLLEELGVEEDQIAEEDQDEFKARYSQGIMLARERYTDYLDSCEEMYRADKGGAFMGSHLEATLGTSLSNMEEWIRDQASKKGVRKTESLTTSDLGTYVRHGFELITALIPNSILDEIVSVQPMDSEQGKAFFLNYVYDSAKDRVEAGDTFAGAKGERNLKANFASDQVDNELAGTGDGSTTDYDGVTRDVPVRPETFVVAEYDPNDEINSETLNAAVQRVSDDGDGNLTGDGTGSITYDGANAGEWSVSFDNPVATDNEVVLQYRYNLDENPAATKRVSMDITNVTMEAEKRQLVTNWLLDVVFELEKHFGKDIDQELIALLAGEIRAEIDQFALRKIRHRANPSNEGPFDADEINYVSQNERNEDFKNTIIADSSQIEDQSGRATGTWVVGGKNVIDLAEGIDDFEKADLDEGDLMGPHFRGTLWGKRLVLN